MIVCKVGGPAYRIGEWGIGVMMILALLSEEE